MCHQDLKSDERNFGATRKLCLIPPRAIRFNQAARDIFNRERRGKHGPQPYLVEGDLKQHLQIKVRDQSFDEPKRQLYEQIHRRPLT